MKTAFPKEKLLENIPVTTRETAMLVTRIRRSTGGVATALALTLLGLFSQSPLVLILALLYLGFSLTRIVLFHRLSVRTFRSTPTGARYFQSVQRGWCSLYRLKITLSLLSLGIGALCFAIASLPSFVRYVSPLYLAGLLFSMLGLRALTAVYFRKRIVFELSVESTEDEEISDDFCLKAERKKAFFGFFLFWLAVAALYLAASLYVGSFTLYLNLPVIALLLSLLRILLNNPFARFSSLRGRTMAARVRNLLAVLAVSAATVAAVMAGSWYNTTYIFTLSYPAYTTTNQVQYHRDSGVFTLKKGDASDFRILQLTDVHIGAGITTVIEDRKAIDACLTLIYETDPDLIIVTGDIAYPAPLQSFSLNNKAALSQFCEMMDRVGIPWAFVLGNHDTEPLASYRAEDLDEVFLHYSHQNGGCLLYADTRPDIFGRYNQYLRLENNDGSLNRLIFLLDSNDYASEQLNDYDTIHADQIDWYEKTVEAHTSQDGVVPSFVFFHIPIPEYADAYNAYVNGLPDARYLFGKNAEGVSRPKENTGLFRVMVDKKSTQAVFVGHDHVNYSGIQYHGIDLIYSKSIDFLAYPGISQLWEQRGGTLIVAGRDGDYTVTQPAYTRDHYKNGLLKTMLSD